MRAKFLVCLAVVGLIPFLAAAADAAPLKKSNKAPDNKPAAAQPNIGMPAFPGFPFQGMAGFQMQPGTAIFKGSININGQQQDFDNLNDFHKALQNVPLDPTILNFFQQVFRNNPLALPKQDNK